MALAAMDDEALVVTPPQDSEVLICGETIAGYCDCCDQGQVLIVTESSMSLHPDCDSAQIEGELRSLKLGCGAQLRVKFVGSPSLLHQLL